MENSNVNVTTNEKKGAEKKPSVFKSICSFIGFIAGAWFFIMSITGGFDNEYEKLQSGDVKGAIDTFIDENIPVKESEKTSKTSSTSGYRTADELEIVWREDWEQYTLYVEPFHTDINKYSDTEPYYTPVEEWLIGKSCYMMDNFVVEYADVTISEIYSSLSTDYWMYTQGNMFYDLRGIDAVENINGLMRENDSPLSIIIEGQILNVEGEGNVIQIFDLSTTEENLYKYENNDYTADLNCLVDISMLDNKDEFFVNDFVTIYAMYAGRIPTQNGSYQPLIVAVAMELQ